MFFLEDHIGNKCTIVCFNVSISSVNIIYIYIYIYIYMCAYFVICKYICYMLYTNSFMCMYYNVLPNKLTHSQHGFESCAAMGAGHCDCAI